MPPKRTAGSPSKSPSKRSRRGDTRVNSIFVRDDDNDPDVRQSIEHDPNPPIIPPIIPATKPPGKELPKVPEGDDNEALRLGKELVSQGQNIFVTGPAGSGKSWYIAKLRAHLESKLKLRVEIIAPTGTAALNVQGRTCHSWMGLTPITASKALNYLLPVANHEATQGRFCAVDVLIIDEVSMIANEFFQQMSLLMSRARRNSQPFGGAVIVAVGDFAQLAPVKPLDFCMHCGEERSISGRGRIFTCNTLTCESNKEIDEGETTIEKQMGIVKQMRIESQWAFCSQAWKDLDLKGILLEKLHRQKGLDYQAITFALWEGRVLTPEQIGRLSQPRTLADTATCLFSLRKKADDYNKEKFDELDTAIAKFTAVDAFYQHERHYGIRHIDKMGYTERGTHFLVTLKEHRYSKFLELRVGMPVVLLSNICIEQGLVNGSQGKVTGWLNGDAIDKLPYARSNRDPLGFNWDSDERVNDNVVRSLRGTYPDVKDDEQRRFILNPANRGNRWPIVKFRNGVERPVFADCMSHEVRHGGFVSLMMRSQVPLVAGWAMTIHKAQGLTLDQAIVDLAGTFDPGQQYVALTRTRQLKDLMVKNLKHELVMGATKEVRDLLIRIFPDLEQRIQERARPSS